MIKSSVSGSSHVISHMKPGLQLVKGAQTSIEPSALTWMLQNERTIYLQILRKGM